MKTSVLFVLTGCLSISVRAQPVLTSNSVYPIGDFSSYVSGVDTVPPGLLTGGANHTWNLSAYNLYSVNGTETQYIDPANTPFAGDFQSANYCSEQFIPVDSNYVYIDFQPGYYEVLGNRFISNGDTTFTNYFDPSRSYIYPFNYLDSYSDYHESYSVSAIATTYRHTTMTLTYYGYGTLLYGGSSAGTVMLLKRVTHSIDTLTVSGNPPSQRIRSGVSYTFFEPGVSGYLLSISYDTTAIGAVTIESYSSSLKGLTPGFKEVYRSTLKLFPNPCSDFISFEAGQIKKYKSYIITDLYGRPVFKGEVEQFSDRINVSSLTSGTYLVRLIGDDWISSQKFIRL